MEAVRTSETSLYSNETTRRYIPESSHLHNAAVKTWIVKEVNKDSRCGPFWEERNHFCRESFPDRPSQELERSGDFKSACVTSGIVIYFQKKKDRRRNI
jgi:hypothetical protein